MLALFAHSESEFLNPARRQAGHRRKGLGPPDRATALSSTNRWVIALHQEVDEANLAGSKFRRIDMEAHHAPHIRFEALWSSDRKVCESLEPWRCPTAAFPFLVEDDCGAAHPAVEAEFERHLARGIGPRHEARARVSEPRPAVRGCDFNRKPAPAWGLRFDVDVARRSRRQVKAKVVKAIGVRTFVGDEIGLTMLDRRRVGARAATEAGGEVGTSRQEFEFRRQFSNRRAHEGDTRLGFCRRSRDGRSHVAQRNRGR
jgi:hypothetical protein